MSDFKVSRGTLGRYKIGDDDFIWTQLENENDAERVCELVNGLNAELTRLRAEIAAARETIKRLNRRAQEAEAALPSWEQVKSSKWAGGNTGRALLVWSLNKQSDEITRLRAELERVRTKRDQLADALNGFDYDGHGTFLRTFGLVKVDGKWEEIEG